jgi:hypothetical protein
LTARATECKARLPLLVIVFKLDNIHSLLKLDIAWQNDLNAELSYLLKILLLLTLTLQDTR